MSILVSVVIPTYNPGPDLDAGIESLVSQTLPADRFEIIVVDDGSTDDTPVHLDGLAERYSNLLVVHSEHSGWAGRPRNLGIKQARGEYIQFVDQDDRMSPDALRRLVEMAQRNHSDVVLGKVASDFRGVALNLYRENRDTCTIHDAPIISSLTPHKMFRRAFLLEHGIAFPEGKRRLEDQLFVVRTYFAARVISILADEPCYFYLRRSDRDNAGATALDPDGYYGNLREVLDVVVANTEPGADRNRLMTRFVRAELLGRLSRPSYLTWDPALRAAMFRNVRDILAEYVDPAVDASLDSVARLRAGLVRADRPDALLQLGRTVIGYRAPSRLDWARWESGRLKIGFTAEIEDANGVAVRFARRGTRILFDPGLSREVVAEPIDVTADLKRLRLVGFVRDRSTSVEWEIPTRVTLREVDVAPDGPASVRPDDGPAVRVLIGGVATVDTEQGAAGRPLPVGEWLLRTRVVALGLDLPGELGGGAADESIATGLPPLFVSPGRLVTLRPDGADKGDRVSLEIGTASIAPQGAVLYERSARRSWPSTASMAGVARRIHRLLPRSMRDRSAAVYRAMLRR